MPKCVDRKHVYVPRYIISAHSETFKPYAQRPAQWVHIQQVAINLKDCNVERNHFRYLPFPGHIYKQLSNELFNKFQIFLLNKINRRGNYDA